MAIKDDFCVKEIERFYHLHKQAKIRKLASDERKEYDSLEELGIVEFVFEAFLSHELNPIMMIDENGVMKRL